MSQEEASLKNDHFFVSENEKGVEIKNVSGPANVLSEKHGEGESPFASSPSLGNGNDIPSPLLLELSEDMSESRVDNTQHVNGSNPEPYLAPTTISAPPNNNLFPSLVEPLQEKQTFVTDDQEDGMSFTFQNQLSMMQPSTFNPDNSFPVEYSETINNQSITFPLPDPVNNGFGYVPFELPSPNWLPEMLDSTGRLELSPVNDLNNSESRAQIGVGFQDNGSNYVDGTMDWTNIHETNFSSQEIQFQQDLGGGMDGQGSLYLGGSTPNHLQFPNLPNNMDGNQGGNFVNNNLLEAGQASSMMGMNMQNGVELQQPGFCNQDGDNITNMENMRLMRNSVYDPTYEEMGMALDPHIRMFLSQDEPENEDGRTNNAPKNR